MASIKGPNKKIEVPKRYTAHKICWSVSLGEVEVLPNDDCQVKGDMGCCVRAPIDQSRLPRRSTRLGEV